MKNIFEKRYYQVRCISYLGDNVVPGIDPVVDAAEHVVDSPEFKIPHDVHCLAAAIAASAVDEVDIFFIQGVELIPEILGIEVDVHGILDVSASKFALCSHVEDDEIGIVCVVLDELVCLDYGDIFEESITGLVIIADRGQD